MPPQLFIGAWGEEYRSEVGDEIAQLPIRSRLVCHFPDQRLNVSYRVVR